MAKATAEQRPAAEKSAPVAGGWPADQVERRPLASLIAYARNARLHSDEQVAQIAASILQWGWTMPVLIDERGEIIAGHGRALAAAKLGLTEIPVMIARGWTDEQKRAYVIADNKLTLNAAWDDALLKLELSDLQQAGFDIGLTGFSTDELNVLWHGAPPSTAGNLAERFGIPPFSVLNAREGWWQDRKAAWLRLGIMSELGRGDDMTWGTGDDIDGHRNGKTMSARANAIPGGSRQPAVDPKTGKIVRADSRGRPIMAGVTPAGLVYGEINSYDGAQRTISGTSIFDPVLCELAYRWFSPPGGMVLDPFAGGSVRGIVAARLGRSYVGVDLSARQLEANRAQAAVILRPDEPQPKWIEGDSRDLSELAQGTNADFVFACPPYADLERYSDDPRDLSTVGYETFRKALGEIIARACAFLKPDRFACFVVGDVRDKAGNYYGFPSHVIEAFVAAGLALYNEAILVTAVGSLPIRAAKQFATSRKLGKTHQNVLVFVKGDARAAADAIGEAEFGAISEDDDGDYGEQL